MHDLRGVPNEKGSTQMRDWWLGCAAENLAAPTRTMFHAFAEHEDRPCQMTVVYLRYPQVARHGFGTIATRTTDHLGGGTFGLFGFGPGSYRGGTFGGGLGDADTAGSRTAISAGPLPHEFAQLPASSALRELSRWTNGTPDVLARLLGASRRSIYNWLKGKPLRGGFGAKTLRLHSVLRPVGSEWHPTALVDWLQSGSPTPAELAQAENWVQLEERVHLARLALQPHSESDATIAHITAAEPLSDAVRLAALGEFASPPPVPARATSDWRPRELTGSTPGFDEE
jgi:hypothetical protein